MPGFRRAAVPLFARGLSVALWLLAPGMAAAQTIPDAPAQLSVDAVVADLVTLSWEASATATPDSYLLEGGFAPGEVAGSQSVSNGATTTQVTLPPGVYFIRIYAVALGVRSAPRTRWRSRWAFWRRHPPPRPLPASPSVTAWRSRGASPPTGAVCPTACCSTSRGR